MKALNRRSTRGSEIKIAVKKDVHRADIRFSKAISPPDRERVVGMQSQKPSLRSRLSWPAKTDSFLGGVLATIARHFAAASASLWQCDEGTGALHLQGWYCQRGSSARNALEHGRRLEQGMKVGRLGRKLNTKWQPIRVNLAESQALLFIPLAQEGDTHGVIGLTLSKATAKELDRIETVHLLSAQIVLAWKLAHILDRKLHSAIAEERTRIARDLHDTLAQTFTSILIQADLADEAISGCQEEARRIILRTRDLAQKALVETRRVVLGLRPAPVEKSCPVEILQQLTNEFNSVGGNVQAEFCWEGSVPALPAEMHTNLFHIAQEALTNVLKHAHATRVQIKFTARTESLRLVVRDDGVGFDVSVAAQNGDCCGLRGIKERANLMGGWLNLSSQPSRGSQVVVTFPLGLTSIAIEANDGSSQQTLVAKGGAKGKDRARSRSLR